MISFVYFDVGGVVIDDFGGNNKWQDLKRELGIDATNDAAFEQIWAKYRLELCIDRDIESLIPIFRQELGLQLPEGYSLMNGFVGRFYANPAIWPIIETVRLHARVGLLTNMYPGMFEAIKQREILPNTKWDVVIDSSIELLQKPDRKLFELAQEKAGVAGKEILFIDNGAEHIREAEEFGWQTFLYEASDRRAATHDLNKFLSLHGFPTSRAARTSASN